MNRGYASKFGMSFQLMHPAEGVIVNGDHDRLMQVMANLLSNAVKFTPEGEVVEIMVTTKEKWVCVAIADHGPGISKEFQERIFEKFAQEDPLGIRHPGGTGLGLNISKFILEALGGTITYDTKIGEGTTFRYCLPIMEIQPPQLEKQELSQAKID